MAGLTLNLTSSVANVGKTLRRMMDALAESGMRHAHREISRGRNDSSNSAAKERARCKPPSDGAVH